MRTKSVKMKTKKTDIIRIVVDTREQTPWEFNSPNILTARSALTAGDYSVSGLEAEIAVERKSLSDFANTLATSKNRKRFYRELARLAEYRRACIIVEANFAEVFAGAGYASKISGPALIGFAAQISGELNIPVYFIGPRAYARLWAESWLRQAAAACTEKAEDENRENRENRNE
jgi:hypothetical protein